MPRGENKEVIADLFDQLHTEFGKLAPQIIETMVICLGGSRVTFPDVEFLYRQERDHRIAIEFNGVNYDELAIKYRLSVRHVRNIVKGES